MVEKRTCPAPAALEAFLLDGLSPPESQAVEDHLLQCDTCLTALEAASAETTILEAVRHLAADPEGPADVALAGLIERLRALPQAAQPPSTAALPGAGPPALPAPGEAQPPHCGKYLLLQPLGQGGMGTVYRAEDERLQRQVALKLMRPEFALVPEYRQRFLREARLAAALDHDHVVPIYEVGEDGSTLFLVMPLLRGQSLAERLKAQPVLPLVEVLRIGREIAQGLAAAHARGLIHRDIKPANIWLERREQGARASGPAPTDSEPGLGWRQEDNDLSVESAELPPPPSPSLQVLPRPCSAPVPDRVKILDFGMARQVESGEGLTQAGIFLGTPGFAAPEQVNGQPVDDRADLFSLGVVLYRMAVGVLPFRGEGTMSVLRAVLDQQPLPPHQLNPEVHLAVSNLILRLLAKDPQDRPPSAQAVVEALQALETDGPFVPPLRPSPQGPPPVPVSLERSRRWRIGLGAAGVLLLVVALAAVTASLWRWHNRPSPDGANGQAPAAVHLIKKLRVLHLEETAAAYQIRELGVDTFAARFDDKVQVYAEFTEPVYAFLLAFNPDGKEQLCIPRARSQQPARQDRLQLGGSDAFPLNDGIGLQAFVVVASRQPLPAYAEWAAQRPAVSWRTVPAKEGAVWRGDGERLKPVTRRGDDRGEIVQLEGVAPLAELGRTLRGSPGVEAVAVEAFAVLPKQGGK
jgi:serine/threonine protein kinase